MQTRPSLVLAVVLKSDLFPAELNTGYHTLSAGKQKTFIYKNILMLTLMQLIKYRILYFNNNVVDINCFILSKTNREVYTAGIQRQHTSAFSGLRAFSHYPSRFNTQCPVMEAFQMPQVLSMSLFFVMFSLWVCNSLFQPVLYNYFSNFSLSNPVSFHMGAQPLLLFLYSLEMGLDTPCMLLNHTPQLHLRTSLNALLS